MIFDSKTNSRGELRKRDYSTKGREAMRIALLDISNVVFEITEIKDGQFFLKRETEGFIKYGK